MYSNDARDMCIRAYLKLRSLRRTSVLLGISKSTVHRWITKHPITSRHTGARKATSDAIKLIESILLNNPFENPAKIASLIHDSLGISLGSSTVRFWMKRQGLTRKKASRFVSTAAVHEKRAAFASDISPLYDPDRVVSIDESSFYFDMKPSHGYCNRSKRLVVPARPGGRMRCSLLMAVTNDQVVGWRLVNGSINSVIFADFMSTLETKERDVILLDNASIHRTHLVQDTMISRGLTPCFLPPYTPDFQPIEHCFSVIKNAFRRLPVSGSDEVSLKCADINMRVEKCICALTPTSLHNQFSACWRRAATFLETAKVSPSHP